jgi:hypothetical protein
MEIVRQATVIKKYLKDKMLKIIKRILKQVKYGKYLEQIPLPP